jgi:hypothetical protein
MRKSTTFLALGLSTLAVHTGVAIAAQISEVWPNGSTPRLTAFAETRPAVLPRDERARAALRIGFTSSTPDGATPELTGIELDLSRSVSLRSAGRFGTVVGHGRVVDELTPPNESPRRIAGPMRITLRRTAVGPRLFGRVTTPAVEYTIPFSIEPAQGIYGTKLVVRRMSGVVGKCVAAHPDCFGGPYTLSRAYGRIADLRMTLGAGFVRASCPAHRRVATPLIGVELRSTDGEVLRGAVVQPCEIAA